jgi:hypothetical protein
LRFVDRAVAARTRPAPVGTLVEAAAGEKQDDRETNPVEMSANRLVRAINRT